MSGLGSPPTTPNSTAVGAHVGLRPYSVVLTIDPRLCFKIVDGVLQAHLWTLRNEDRYLPWDFEQDVHNAYDFYLSHEVDAIFTDFPKSLVKYLDMVYNRN